MKNSKELIDTIRQALKDDGVLSREWAINFENRGQFIAAEIQVTLLIPADNEPTGGQS